MILIAEKVKCKPQSIKQDKGGLFPTRSAGVHKGEMGLLTSHTGTVRVRRKLQETQGHTHRHIYSGGICTPSWEKNRGRKSWGCREGLEEHG